ncbi:hypothetical protein HK097_011673 [Rhizophlyctis rosea]|uniref:F-box domain-containing protein n=1 Tax=Rhizophlyctis rosea TaxID=64517 RepID=A0AAD5X4Q8_9FUNG|nr:hypothetical protein HK097_011673 [Rhizophlyctis rosea]
MSPTPTASIADLPAELLTQILAKLSLSNLMYLRRVSRTFLLAANAAVLPSLRLDSEAKAYLSIDHPGSYLPPLRPAVYDTTTQTLTLLPKSTAKPRSIRLAYFDRTKPSHIVPAKLKWKPWSVHPTTWLPHAPGANLNVAELTRLSDTMFHESFRPERARQSYVNVAKTGTQFIGDRDWILELRIEYDDADEYTNDFNEGHPDGPGMQALLVTIVSAKVTLPWTLSGLNASNYSATNPASQIFANRFEKAAVLAAEKNVPLLPYHPSVLEYLYNPSIEASTVIETIQNSLNSPSVNAPLQYTYRRHLIEQYLESKNIHPDLLWKYGRTRRYMYVCEESDPRYPSPEAVEAAEREAKVVEASEMYEKQKEKVVAGAGSSEVGDEEQRSAVGNIVRLGRLLALSGRATREL